VTGLDVGEVKTPDQYRKLKADLMSGNIKLPEEQAPEAAPSEPYPVEPEDDDAPATGGRKPSMKVPLPDDPDMANLQSETMRIVRDRNRAKKPISFSEAEVLAKQILGIADTASTASPQATPESTPPTETPSDDQPQTLEEVSQAITALVKKKAENNQVFNFDEDVEIEAQLEKLRDHKAELAEQRRLAQAGAKTLEQSWEASQAKVQQQYPDAKIADSVLNMVASKIEENWRSSGDPRLNSPNAPEILYAEAAKKVGQPAPKSPIPPPSKPVSRLPAAAAVLASGSAGSIAPISSTQHLDVSKITDPYSYQQVKNRVTGGQYASVKQLR